MNRIRTALRELLWLSFYSLLAVVMTWPLARLLDRAVSDHGDPLLNIWILHWDYVATFTSAPLWHANIFFPAQWSLAFSENLYGIALLTFPLRIAGVDPITTYNVAMIGGFALAGYGMHVLARVLLAFIGTRWMIEIAALVAGIFYAFVPYRFDHLSHLQHVWSGWIPLLLSALIVLVRAPRLIAAVAFTLAYLMNGLSNVHWLLFSAVTVPLVAVVVLALGDRLRDRRTWLRASLTYLIANLLLVPFLIPYKIAANEYGMHRGIDETSIYSAIPADWTVGVERSATWGDLNEEIRKSERSLFPGGMILLLSLASVVARIPGRMGEPLAARSETVPPPTRLLDWTIAAGALAVVAGMVLANQHEPSLLVLRLESIPPAFLASAVLLRFWYRFPSWMQTSAIDLREWLSRRRRPDAYWIGLTLIIIGVLGSLGLNGPLHSLLYAVAEPFRSLRVPARWAMMAYCGLGLTGALGALAVIHAVPRKGRIVVAALIPALMFAELFSAPLSWDLITDPEPRVYEWLADAPITGGVLELPIRPDTEFAYVQRATLHDRPLLNGFSGFETALHARLIDLFRHPAPPEGTFDLIEEQGASLLIVHNDYREVPAETRAWLLELLGSGRLRYLRRFPHRMGHDYVFALPANEHQIDALEDPEAETVHLMTFLETNEITPIEGTFGVLDFPTPNSEVGGELTIAGWALSPHGIREVNLLFENAGVRFSTERYEDPRIFDHYPWYEEQVPLPRFRAQFSERPASVSQRTDLVVEIIDDLGRVTWLPQLRFRWTRQQPIEPAQIAAWNEPRLEALLERMGHSSDRAPEVVRGQVSIEQLAVEQIGALSALDDEAFVAALYPILLARSPDEQGLEMYAGKLRDGTSREAVVRMILSSDEFRLKHSN